MKIIEDYDDTELLIGPDIEDLLGLLLKPIRP